VRRRAIARRLRSLLLLNIAVIAGGLALLVESGAALKRTELASIDARFGLRGEQPAPADMVVVAVDDRTFNDYPRERWPFDRGLFARALSNVSKGHPRLVVYDVQFTEEQGSTPEDVRADNALVTATRRAGNVVLSTTEVAADGSTRVFGSPVVQRYARATVGNGLVPEDPGGVLRRIPYEIDGLRSLSVAAVERMGRRVDRSLLGDDGMWVDYAGPAGHVKAVSFSRVENGSVAPATFRDKIVVIGATAPSLHDRHPVPVGDEAMSGPEIHANAISTLLRGVPLRSGPRWLDVVIALAMALFVPLAGMRIRVLTAAALGVGLAVVYAVGTQVAFNAGHILPVVAPLLGLAVATVGALGAHGLTETVEKAQVRDLFARFVPDSVVDEVLTRANREDPRIGGVRLTSTVMFSDLRGFTRFAEHLDPGEVIRVLNRYLTLMSDAILDHGGTLVAYMGDGIMAVFGAPIATDDHADRALDAAREMLRRLEEFNRWIESEGLGEPFKMGIGLNTGGVMSGNVGSSRRVEYTAIGDTTNTAARLEASTKGTPHQILVAETVRAAMVREAPDLEQVGDIEIRGRSAVVRVWTLRGSAVEAPG
jgi:adenylate cyclase